MSEKFESQIKSLLDEVQLEPHDAVWQQVRKEIRPEKRRKRFVFWWLLPVVLAGGGLVYFLNGDGPTKKAEPVVGTIETPKTVKEAKVGEVNTTGAQTEQSPVAPVLITATKSQKKVYGTMVLSQGPGNKGDFISSTKSRKKVQQQSPQVATGASHSNQENDGGGADVVVNVPPVVHEDAPVQVAQVDSSSVAKPLAPMDSTLAATTMPVKVRAKSAWRLGVTVQLGLAGKSDPLISMTKSMENFSAGSGSGPTSGIGSTIRQSSHVKQGLLYGVGLVAERDMLKHFTLRASLGYQHQSFSAVTERVKDSMATSGLISLPWYKSTDRYSLHILDVSTGMSVKLYGNRSMKLGLGASFDNLFVIGAKTRRNESIQNGNASSANMSMDATGSYRTWQPHIGLSLPVNFYTKQPGMFQLSPYLRYGIRASGNQGSAGNKHLSSFGISATYFFK
ncbi:MAG: hypothetical protein K0Q66_117 [Chitinophagaceae bacterium]|jgi:hypothetical protein|nr:hypothetical protein [Chitinophagaceae bacterium]